MKITTKNARLLLLVCGNIQTLSRGSYMHEEAGHLLSYTIREALKKLPFVADVALDRLFENWNGGPYSDQNLFGYRTFGGIVCCLGAIVNSKTVKWAKLPKTVRTLFEQQIYDVITRARAAADQYEADLTAAENNLAAAHAEEN